MPYPQPYVIQAVGDQGALLDAIEDDDYLDVYRDAGRAARHLGRLGRSSPRTLVTAPAYDGLLDLNYAEPIR